MEKPKVKPITPPSRLSSLKQTLQDVKSRVGSKRSNSKKVASLHHLPSKLVHEIITPEIREYEEIMTHIAEAAEPDNIQSSYRATKPPTAEFPKPHPPSSDPDHIQPNPRFHRVPSNQPPAAVQICWEDDQIPLETTKEFLLDTPIEGWRAYSPSRNEQNMDPDTCRALGIGIENGISYDYIDRIDPDAFLSSTSRATTEITTNSVSGRSRPNSGGRKSRVSSPLKLDQLKSQIKQSSAEYFDLGIKSSEVMPIDLISPPPKGEGITIPVAHTIDDDDEQEELPLITETHFAPSTVNYLEWHDKNPDQKQPVQVPLPSSSLVTQEQASVNKLPPLKLYSKGYAISEPSSTLQKPPKPAFRKTKVVRVTSDEVILSQQHLEDIQEGLSTITIRNWQLKQEPSDFFGSAEEFRSQHSSVPDRNRVSERPSVYRDDDLAGLPTLGSIGLVIKPIRPISGTVRRTKKDAVWGQGGKRRHF